MALIMEDERPKDGESEREGRRFGWHAWWREAKSQPPVSAIQFLPLYYVAAILLFLLLGNAIEYLLPESTPRLLGALLAKAVLAISIIVPAFGIAKIERRQFGDYGLSRAQAFGRTFWAGVLWGLVSLSALLFTLRACGVLSLGGPELHGLRVWKFALFWAAFFLLVAFFEEYAFRGYVQFAVQQVAGFWPTALLLSAIFAYTHKGNPGENWFGALGAGAVGLFFCFTLRRTGNLWFAVGMHASWDWAQSFFYGVPDSGVVEPGHLFTGSLHGPSWLTGGTVGPEGSLLLFLWIAIMWALFDRVYPPKTGV